MSIKIEGMVPQHYFVRVIEESQHWRVHAPDGEVQRKKRIFEEACSYSKADANPILMRMGECHVRNDQQKPDVM